MNEDTAMTIPAGTTPGLLRPMYYLFWGALPGLAMFVMGYLMLDKGLYANLAVVLWGIYVLAPLLCMNILLSLWIILVRRATRSRALLALWSLTLIGLPLGAATGVLQGLIQ